LSFSDPVLNRWILYFYLMRWSSLFLVLVILLCSCARRMIETSLYFGQSRPDGSKVTGEEWEDFKSKYVLKVFKEGATAIPVSGNWFDQGQRQLISESTYIVVYLHKPSPSLSRKIDALREQYKKLYGQESVLRVDKSVSASF